MKIFTIHPYTDINTHDGNKVGQEGKQSAELMETMPVHQWQEDDTDASNDRFKVPKFYPGFEGTYGQQL